MCGTKTAWLYTMRSQTHRTYFRWTLSLFKVCSAGHIKNRLLCAQIGQLWENIASIVKLISFCDGTCYTEHNDTIFVAASWILMEWNQLFIHHIIIWDTIYPSHMWILDVFITSCAMSFLSCVYWAVFVFCICGIIVITLDLFRSILIRSYIERTYYFLADLYFLFAKMKNW